MAGKRDEVTIAEVAEALNISKTTVSRAISGKGRVSEATRARVFDYIGKGRQDAAAPLRTAQQGPTNNLAGDPQAFYAAGLAVPAQVHGRCVEHGGPARV